MSQLKATESTIVIREKSVLLRVKWSLTGGLRPPLGCKQVTECKFSFLSYLVRVLCWRFEWCFSSSLKRIFCNLSNKRESIQKYQILQNLFSQNSSNTPIKAWSLKSLVYFLLKIILSHLGLGIYFSIHVNCPWMLHKQLFSCSLSLPPLRTKFNAWLYHHPL